MSDQYTRREFLKKAYKTTIGALFVTSLSYSYARYVEPNQLAINHFEINSPLIPRTFNGIKILQFSDTHIGHYYTIDQFNKLIQKINQYEADLILFTGDLIDAPHEYQFTHDLLPLLKNIQAPLGKYSIYGNHDHGGYGTESYKDLMDNSGFKLLMNEAIQISNEGETIYLAGLDDYMLGRPDFEQTLGHIPENSFTILLAHEPDVAKVSQSYPVQLQLSGHSHGGQIQLPFLGPIVTPPFASEYTEGFYFIGSGPEQMTLYVNRGIGTTRVPFRFLAKPEVSIFTLRTPL